MANLNRGVRLPSDAEIYLNNNLFETHQGTLLFTFRPDDPEVTARTVTNLFAGATSAERIKLQLVDDPSLGDGYKIIASSNGTSGAISVEGPNTLLSYEEEVTIAVRYDDGNTSGNGFIQLIVNRVDPVTGVNTTSQMSQTGSTDFVANLTEGATAQYTALANPAILGLSAYQGFISKLATYDSMLDEVTVNQYVTHSVSWPTDGLVHFLDLTALSQDAKVVGNQPEVQVLKFGPPAKSGTIYVDGVAIEIRKEVDTTGPAVAQKVFDALNASPEFTRQLFKQKIIFEPTAASVAGATFKIGDATAVAVPATFTTTLAAETLQDVLAASGYATDAQGTPRSFHLNSTENSITVTFTDYDSATTGIGVTKPGITLSTGDPSTTKVLANINTLQSYSATGSGRTLELSGDTVSIKFSPLDGASNTAEVTNFAVTNATAALNVGPVWDPESTGIVISRAGETSSSTNVVPSVYPTPSTFQFLQAPVGEVQKLIVTKPSSAANSFDLVIPKSGGLTETVPVTPPSATATPSDIATAIKTALDANGNVTASMSGGASGITVNGDTVTLNFLPSLNNVLTTTFADTNTSGSNVSVVTSREYASNTRGESQTINFFGSVGTAGNIVVDGVTVAVSASDTAAAVATKVETALQKQSAYAVPEIQTLLVTKATASATLTVAGVSITLGATDDTPEEAATKIAADIATGIATAQTTWPALSSITSDGSLIQFTFARDGYMADAVPITYSGITASAIKFSSSQGREEQQYASDGVRQTSISGSSLTITAAASENDIPPISVNTSSTASGITAAVNRDFRHHSVDLTSTSYTGGGGGVVVVGGAEESDVFYLELTSASTPSGGATSKTVTYDIYVDPDYAADIGDTYEAASFTLNYATTDFSGLPVVNFAQGLGRSNSVVDNGNIFVSWLNSGGTDLSRPIASVTMTQVSSGGFKASPVLSFSNVNLDGVDFSDGTTYASSFSDSLRTDRVDIKSTLVSAFDGTSGIGGQLVSYYASPTVANAKLRLSYNDSTDLDGEPLSTSSGKVVTMDVVTDQATTRNASFVLELPSNALDAEFVVSAAATAAGMTATSTFDGGHTLTVDLAGTGAGTAAGASLGTVSVTLSNGLSRTHEIAFQDGTTKINGSAVSAKGFYYGFTVTSTASATKGAWSALDIPQGDFSYFITGTADPLVTTRISQLDALQILKVAALEDPDWKASYSASTRSDAIFASADINGDGRVNSSDALMALRIAAQDPDTDTGVVEWRFFDSATSGLNYLDSSLEATKKGMTVASNDITISSSVQAEFKQVAILVGNLTDPASDTF
jgi:hypothetical protein